MKTRVSRRTLLSGITLLLVMASVVYGGPSRPPNVVLIMTDNHGAWTLGCYGNRDIRTPHIDRLASEGVRFTRCYSSNAVCSPTRATYLTGLLPSQHGVHCYLRAGRLQTGPQPHNTLAEFRSLPEILAQRGYECGLSGKWHLGANLQPQEGFHFWVTMPHGGTQTFYDAEVIENGQIHSEPTYLTDYWTRRGVEFIEKNRDRPFFLFLAYNGPYGLGSSLTRPARNRHAAYYADKYLPSFPRGAMHPWLHSTRQFLNNDDAIRRYAAEVSGVDDGVGQIMSTLKRLDLDEETLVIFTADQGWVGGQGGLWGMGDHTRPLHAFDGTMHVPLIFRHAGSIPRAKTSDVLTSNYDLLPTVLDYLGAKRDIPRAPPRPGRSYAQVLRGETVEWDDVVFYEFENVRAVRTADHKLIERYPDGPHELYDLAADPGERNNLVDDQTWQRLRSELHQRLHEFFRRYADPKYDLWQGGTSQTRLITEDLFSAAESGRGDESASATSIITRGLASNYLAGENPGHPQQWLAAGGSRRSAWTIGPDDPAARDEPRLHGQASTLPGFRIAYQFDGVDDRMVRAPFTGPTSSSFELWVNPGGLHGAGDQVIFETGEANRGLSLRQHADTIRLVHAGGEGGGPTVLEFDLDPDDDGKVDIDGAPWYEFIQIAAVVDTGPTPELALFVNGRKRGAVTKNALDFHTGAGPAGLGGPAGETGGGRVDADPLPSSFRGQVAVLRRYTQPLSPREVRHNFDVVADRHGTNALTKPPSYERPPLAVPPGFSVEVAAAPPLVAHPMMAALDDRGRLFVAESSGINMKAPELLEAHPHQILMLEDRDGDGQFDHRTVFADNMVLPNGALWHDGSLYVCSAPYIWRLEDTDDDGVADIREPILGKFGFNGMSSAFHGPVLGPDGRFYWCGGQHGWVLGDTSSGLELAGPWTSNAAGVYSCWPDGSEPEDRAHGGLANPVEVTFSEEGEVFGTVAVYTRLNQQRYDAVLHWIEGASSISLHRNSPRCGGPATYSPP